MNSISNNSIAQSSNSSNGSGMATAGLVLGILAVVFGIIPLVNVIAIPMGVLAVIFGLIGIIKKAGGKAIAGFVLGIISLVIIFGMYHGVKVETNTSSGNSTNNSESKTDDSSDKSSKSDNDAKKWTKEQYDALTTGDLMNNYVGGTAYADVIAAHGEPSSKSDSEVNGVMTRAATWDNFDSSEAVHVISLTFSGKDESSLLLSSKSQTGLE